MSRLARWTLLDFGFTEEIADKARKQAAAVGGYSYGDREAGGGSVLYVLKESKEKYSIRETSARKILPSTKFPSA